MLLFSTKCKGNITTNCSCYFAGCAFLGFKGGCPPPLTGHWLDLNLIMYYDHMEINMQNDMAALPRPNV